MWWLRELARRRVRDVSGVEDRTAVRLECRVASPDRVVSPTTGVTAALVRWSLLDQKTLYSSRGGGAGGVRYRKLASGLYGSEPLLLEVDGHTIAVPLGAARLELIEDPEDGELVQSLPGELSSIAARLELEGALAYRESFLQRDSEVRLTATLERLGQGDGYRGSARAGAEFGAVDDDVIRVEER